ncbi:hypothetical protein HPCPY1662_1108 [Helicobacter pylori CPY1662]|nr:hypothetical protein HPCPY1662_1108 [Helicobacter pylori CPY1662]
MIFERNFSKMPLKSKATLKNDINPTPPPFLKSYFFKNSSKGFLSFSFLKNYFRFFISSETFS